MTVRDSAARVLELGSEIKENGNSLLYQSYRGARPRKGIPIPSILPHVRFSVKERLRKHLRQCRDADLCVRYLIIINLLNGRSAQPTADVLRVHVTTVYRVAGRFRQQEEWGLLDHRSDNGTTKLDEQYLDVLYRVVRSSPDQYGWRRPTWTREMLVETLRRETGQRIHVATMSRALALVKARRGRPRPVVRCPWSPWAKTRRFTIDSRSDAGHPDACRL